MRYTDFIWDFDGTLFDTYPYIVERYRCGALTLGIAMDTQALLPLVKRSLSYANEALGRTHGIAPAALQDAYNRHDDGGAYAYVAPYAGIPALLADIVKAGGRNHLYTHSGHEVFAALDRHGLTGSFTAFLTAEDGFPLKPCPDALAHLIKTRGLNPARCVMTGDRSIDVDAGKNAGMAGALLDLDGFYPDATADHRFESIAQMRQVFLAQP